MVTLHNTKIYKQLFWVLLKMIKKGDFIEIDYIAKIKGTNIVFDLTQESKAKELNIYNPKVKYGPVVVCVGEKNLLNGLDDALVGKEIGSFEVEIGAKNAFGLKNPKFLKVVKKDIFLQQNINPFVGLQVNIDGAIGVIRSVSGGRSIVDFNHPLAGRDVSYYVDIRGMVTESIEKIKSIISFNLFLSDSDYVLEKRQDDNIEIKTKMEIPKELIDIFMEKYTRLVSKDKNVVFVFDKNNTTTAK